MKIFVISGAFPPQLDGIGDYAALLSAELVKSADVTVLTGCPNPKPIPEVTIRTAFSVSDPQSIREIIPRVKAANPDWIILQYNPFSFGRWGLNLDLPEVLRIIKKDCQETRIVVMVHEPFVPTTTCKFAVMATWQRWQLWRLGNIADVLFFSIENWQRRFQGWFPGKAVQHLPVASNIPYVSICKAEARARLGIDPETTIIGLFGNAGSGRMLDRAKDAVAAVNASGKKAKLLYVGPDKQQICAAFSDGDVIAEGASTPQEVSRRLTAMDVYLAAYVDGVSTRRGAFIAALQHGVAAVATRGPLTDKMFEQEDGRSFLLANVNDAEAFHAAAKRLAADADQRDRLGEAARSLYQAELSWETISSRLIAALN